MDCGFIKTSWTVCDSINKWPANSKALENLKTIPAKENIPKECRKGDTCFTSLSTIEGNLFGRHTKNIHHLHKYSKDLLAVIIKLKTNVICVETVFNGLKINESGKREHVLEHAHGKCVVGTLVFFSWRLYSY